MEGNGFQEMAMNIEEQIQILIDRAKNWKSVCNKMSRYRFVYENDMQTLDRLLDTRYKMMMLLVEMGYNFDGWDYKISENEMYHIEQKRREIENTIKDIIE